MCQKYNYTIYDVLHRLSFLEIDLLVNQIYRRDAEISIQIFEATQAAGSTSKSTVHKFLFDKRKILQEDKPAPKPDAILEELNLAEQSIKNGKQ